MIDFKQKIAEQISKTTNIPQEQIIEYIDSQHNNKANETVLNIEGFDMDAFIKLVMQHI